MSDSWQHARGLAKQLQRELPEHGEISDELQARLERTVRQALVRRSVTRRRQRVLLASVAGAVAIAAATLVALRHEQLQPAASPLAKREVAPIGVEGELFLRGDDEEPLVGTLAATNTPLRLRSGAHTSLRLTPQTTVELRDAVVVVERFGSAAGFFLERGGVGVDTPATVSVRTAEGEIRGAAFEVERNGSPCGGVRVVSKRGDTEVRTAQGTRTVAAGTSWFDCPTLAAVPTAHASAGASLEDQNEALASAVSARREGRTDEALRAYGSFLKRWPTGPLSEVARAERMTLLEKRDPAAAQRAARDYLHFHPNGPARERARALAQEGNP